jgi:hypothetical protein
MDNNRQDADAPDNVTITAPMTTIGTVDREHAERLELLEMQAALDQEAARRRAEEKASRWLVRILAEVLKELRAPEPPELVDARDISDEEREEEAQCADTVDLEIDLEALEAEIEALEAAGGNVHEYIEERRRQSFEEALARLGPDHDRKGPRYADALPLIEAMHARGISLHNIARMLNALEIPTARHGRWYPTAVKVLLEKRKARA